MPFGNLNTFQWIHQKLALHFPELKKKIASLSVPSLLCVDPNAQYTIEKYGPLISLGPYF